MKLPRRRFLHLAAGAAAVGASRQVGAETLQPPSEGAQKWFKIEKPVNDRQGGVCVAAFQDFIRSVRPCGHLMNSQPRKRSA